MKLHLIIPFILILTLFSCKKEIPEAKEFTETFTKSISEAEDQNIVFFAPTADNNFIFLAYIHMGVSGIGYPLYLYKVSPEGRLISKTLIGQLVSRVYCRQLPDYSILFNTADGGQTPGYLGKLDPNGNLLFLTNYKSSYIGVYSWPVQLKDGRFIVTNTNGQSTGSASTNQMQLFDAQGKWTSVATLPDAEFGFKVMFLGVHKCDTIGTYYFNGWGVENWIGNWNTNKQMFVAKRIYKGPTLVYNKVKIIDPLNEVNYNEDYQQYVASDGKLVMLATQVQPDGIKIIRFVMVDDSLNVLTKRDIKIGTRQTIGKGVIETADGHFLITGGVVNDNKTMEQPFAAKVDRQGNVLWSKTYTTLLGGFFVNGQINGDASMLFAGQTSGFGRGKNGNDLFLMRVDKNGNMKQ